MTRGLKTLHSMNILHRDMKCANVFISKDKIYKLGDLNVSKVDKSGLVLTQTGTPYYAAPEVWKGVAYDSSCDIWSLGCIIYEMATLKPPFRANDMTGLYNKIKSGKYDPLPRIYSNELNLIIGKFLKVEPKLRPKCDAILNDPIVLKNMKDGGKEMQKPMSKGDLLKTILLPKNMKILKEKLPKANYNEMNNSFEIKREENANEKMYNNPSERNVRANSAARNRINDEEFYRNLLNQKKKEDEARNMINNPQKEFNKIFKPKKILNKTKFSILLQGINNNKFHKIKIISNNNYSNNNYSNNIKTKFQILHLDHSSKIYKIKIIKNNCKNIINSSRMLYY